MATRTAALRAVALLDADPDLAQGIPAEELPYARRAAVAPLHVPAPGPWAPGAAEDFGTGVTGLLVLRGLLTRDVLLESRTASQLVGPGDLIAPWTLGETLLPVGMRWTVTGGTTLAVLDERFTAAGRRWPQLVAAVRERAFEQQDRAAVQGAIAQLPRVELRILALLWHLADQWGRVTGAGVALPLRLTHETLGRLVGAQRPTVTLAVGQLLDDDMITRRDDGTLLLHARSRDALAPDEQPLVRAGVQGVEAGGALRRRAPEAVEPPAAPLAGELDGAELVARLDGLRDAGAHLGARTRDLLDTCRRTLGRSAELRDERALSRRPRERRPAAP